MPACKISPLVSSLRVPSHCGIDQPGPYTLSSVGITQSLLGSFQMCRRRFLLSINRWRYPGDGIKFGYGSMAHEVLDKMYTGFMKKAFTYSDLGEVVTVELDNYDLGKAWRAEDAEMAKAKAQAMLECYILVYKRDFTELRFEAVEEPFNLMWQGFRLRGKKDGRFRDRNKGVWNMEHKNYSQIKEDSLPLVLSYDLQNLFYMLADKIQYGRLLNGVLYNILRNPEVRKKDGGPHEVYKVLKEKIMHDPKHYFIRYELPYGPGDMAQFEGELNYKLQEIEDLLTVPPEEQFCRFYKNERACLAPYACEFMNACATGRLTGYEKSPRFYNELVVDIK